MTKALRAPQRVSGGPARFGMTIVEMLVAMAATLLIMSVVAQLFSLLGRTVSQSTNVQDMNAQLRSAARILRRDLDGITVDAKPPARADREQGYLEIIEGTAKDGLGIAGDWDDAILFTSTSLSEPYRGSLGGIAGGFQSQAAEIAWFCAVSNDQPLASYGITTYTLYRRQLLAAAYIGEGPFATENRVAFSNLPTFYQANDISARCEGLSREWLYPNSLSDLTKRENRFLHAAAFPHQFLGDGNAGAILTGDRLGDDVVLTNVIAFDVRVFDPLAAVRSAAGVPAIPGDAGYGSGAVAGTGAYVDLGWDTTMTNSVAPTATFPPSGQSVFQGRGVSLINAATVSQFSVPTYDTWSTHYETNGRDENGVNGADEGTNGRDDNNNGLVDEFAETETSAPYPIRLRGIEIRIRCCDPRSRQIRQVTVRHAFVPR
jgi:hypothetical protein